ncbi:hypothetical protein ACOME3_004554 [Neoechinorhynchus agilis]
MKYVFPVIIVFVVIVGVLNYRNIILYAPWQVIIISMSLPMFGFLAGFTISFALKRPRKDIIAICVETGVQNVGIAIFMLSQYLDEPFASLVVLCPILVAAATPIPLLTYLIFTKVKNRIENKQTIENEMTPIVERICADIGLSDDRTVELELSTLPDTTKS